MRRSQAIPWMLVGVSWVVFFGWATFRGPQNETLERAESVEDAIAARSVVADSLEALVASQASQIADLGAQYTADSARWVQDRDIEVRIRRQEQRAFRTASDSLRLQLDSVGLALVAELEIAHVEVVRTYELELGTLRDQVTALEEQRAALFGQIETLGAQVENQALIISEWEEVNRLKDEHIGRAKRQKWYERTAAVLVIGCSFLCPG